jgi:hypothetical protein
MGWLYWLSPSGTRALSSSMGWLYWLWVVSITFNHTSVTSMTWQSVLLVEDNNRPARKSLINCIIYSWIQYN